MSELNQDCCSIIGHNAQSIAREASAARAASFKRQYRNVAAGLGKQRRQQSRPASRTA